MAEDRWAGATAAKGDHEIIFRYVTHVPEGVEPADFPHLLMIIWPYESANVGQMPDGATVDWQSRFEDLIDPALESAGNAHLVWIRTGEGERVWWWYSRDLDEAVEIINRTLANEPPFPIQIEPEPDDGWSAWREFIGMVRDSGN